MAITRRVWTICGRILVLSSLALHAHTVRRTRRGGGPIASCVFVGGATVEKERKRFIVLYFFFYASSGGKFYFQTVYKLMPACVTRAGRTAADGRVARWIPLRPGLCFSDGGRVAVLLEAEIWRKDRCSLLLLLLF